jgi:hypothetical protein
MGQQQLLLIVLGTIIVGLAIVVGINLFRASAVDAARDAVAIDLEDLAARAQAHYRRPRTLGGGDRTFTIDGVTVLPINALTTTPTNANGQYSIDPSSSRDSLVIIGQGYELVGNLPVEVKITVTGDNARMEVIR